jgi:hypothetical protein
MFRVARIALAAILALTVAALPLMLDRCAESCEGHQPVTPACHHVTATGEHMSQVPSSCGHDHNGTAVLTAKRSVSIERAFVSLATSASQCSIESPARADLRVRPHSPPDTSPLGDRTLPLRV